MKTAVFWLVLCSPALYGVPMGIPSHPKKMDPSEQYQFLMAERDALIAEGAALQVELKLYEVIMIPKLNGLLHRCKEHLDNGELSEYSDAGKELFELQRQARTILESLIQRTDEYSENLDRVNASIRKLLEEHSELSNIKSPEHDE